ncbi:MAG TPA: DUF3306 domain-containing protein [Casimicrobiaceae bacterium]
MSGNDGRSPGTSGRDDNRTTFSLRRWSQRKHASAREAKGAERVAEDVVPAVPSVEQPAEQPAVQPVVRPDAAAVPPELPPIETLTIDSDFAPFMRTGVDPVLRREALKKLLHDPRFNVMDGLDVYIDDYTKTKPIEPSLARKLAARLHPRASADEHETADAAVTDTAVAEVAMADASVANVAVADTGVADATAADATVIGVHDDTAVDAAPPAGTH